MRELTEAERLHLTETQSLTLDEAGREALIGLTHEESCALMAYRRRLTAGNTDQDPENLAIWLELAERHSLARPLFDSAALSRLDHVQLIDEGGLVDSCRHVLAR